jgi:site-specific DNA-methyltransferase (adenine-specific)
MDKPNPFENQILLGDCLEWLEKIPEGSIDLIFADPPYNLQLRGDLWRPNMTRVHAVEESWDQFESFQHYDEFSQAWLAACRRVLKEDGALWVIGSYHNIFRLGKIIQDLGYWILNDVLWVKTNPMPNFRGVRFTNAHETLIWAAKSKEARYSFNHHAMKALNEGKQMRSDWYLPICSGEERVKTEGHKAHPTQKPEALLYRVLLSSSQSGDLVLDPFFGMGTTGVVAKKLHRRWIGIEREAEYVKLAQARIDVIQPISYDKAIFDVRDHKRLAPRIAFVRLIEHGFLSPGQKLYFRRDPEQAAVIRPDGKLIIDGFQGSIHQVGRHLSGGAPCNGWEHWYYELEGEYFKIDVLRDQFRAQSSS